MQPCRPGPLPAGCYQIDPLLYRLLRRRIVGQHRLSYPVSLAALYITPRTRWLFSASVFASRKQTALIGNSFKWRGDDAIFAPCLAPTRCRLVPCSGGFGNGQKDWQVQDSRTGHAKLIESNVYGSILDTPGCRMMVCKWITGAKLTHRFGLVPLVGGHPLARPQLARQLLRSRTIDFEMMCLGTIALCTLAGANRWFFRL